MRVVCVIPARLASQRFPRKVLAMLGEKPLLKWVWEAARSTDCFDDLAFAIDSEETAELIDSFDGKYFMTSPHAESGTDRLAQLCLEKKMEGEIWVNWQGDEPFIKEEMVKRLLSRPHDPCEIWTLKKKIERREEIEDPNVVKVVTDLKGRALYFSRLPIPFNRDGLESPTYYKHLGLYAYRQEALIKMSTLPKSSLEASEKLEQLRFMEHGMSIQVHETFQESLGIDVIEDLKRAHERLQEERLIKS